MVDTGNAAYLSVGTQFLPARLRCLTCPVACSGQDQDQRGGGGGWHGPGGADNRHLGPSAPGFGGPPAFHGGYGPDARGPPGGPGEAPVEAGRGRGFAIGRGRNTRGGHGRSRLVARPGNDEAQRELQLCRPLTVCLAFPRHSLDTVGALLWQYFIADG